MRPGGLYSHHSDSNRSDLRPLRSNGSVCSSNCESVNSGKSSTKTINTEASENVHVVVRCRNRTIKEKTLESPVIIQLPDENQHGNHVTVRTSLDPSVSTQLSSARTYTVDRVFGPELTQEEIFDEIGKPLCEDFIKGYNCTVFAYGQTGAGKTYTMTGSMDGVSEKNKGLPERSGLIPRFISQIFSSFEDDPHLAGQAVLKCSFVEIYNEQLRDLLSSTKSSRSRIRIYEKETADESRNGKSKEIAVDGLEAFQIRTLNEGISLLKQGIQKRSTASTEMNKRSSRSHALFTLTLLIKSSGPESEARYRISKLNLVDLAGSENISRSGSKHARAKEAGSINQSLLTLGRVITALSDGNRYIPYRESKLTRLLQDSLGGQTKTILVANISPVMQDLQSTISTMEYASKAKNIRNSVQIGPLISNENLVRQLVEENYKLKLDLRATRRKNGVYMDQEHYKQIIRSLAALKNEISELKSANLMSENKIEHLSKRLEQETHLKECYKLNLNSSETKLVDVENKLSVQQKSYMNLISLADSLVFAVNNNIGVLDKEQDKMWSFLKGYLSDTFKPLTQRMQCVIDKNVKGSIVNINSSVRQELDHTVKMIDEIKNTINDSLLHYIELQKDIGHRTKERLIELQKTKLHCDNIYKQAEESYGRNKSLIEESKLLNDELYQQMNLSYSNKEMLVRELMIFNASKMKEYQKEVNQRIAEMFKDLTSLNALNMTSIFQMRTNRTLDKWMKKSTNYHDAMGSTAGELFNNTKALDQEKTDCIQSFESSVNDDRILTEPNVLKKVSDGVLDLSEYTKELKDGHVKLYNNGLSTIDCISECHDAMKSLSTEYSNMFDGKYAEILKKKSDMSTKIAAIFSEIPKGTKRVLQEIDQPNSDVKSAHLSKKLAIKDDVLTENQVHE